MKRIVIFACVVAFGTGCSTVTKKFSVTVDPPEAEITVVPGGGQPEQKYRSPADITVSIPKDPELAEESRLEVTLEEYKPKIIGLRHIESGDAISVKLVKIIHYLLHFQLLAPIQSADLQYRDREMAVSFSPGERQFDLNLTNNSGKILKILWDRAEYTDYVNRPHRLMHSGIRPQDRNNQIPPQEVQPGESVQLSVMPVTSVVYSRAKKGYENKLLYPVNSDKALALKGRVVYLFLPVEIDRAIIPYNFKFLISEVVKEQ